MYLVFSVFTSRPTSLLVSIIIASVFFLCGIYVFTQYIIIISTDQEVVCSIQFPSVLIFLDLLDGIF
jgi:hypothetical protein